MKYFSLLIMMMVSPFAFPMLGGDIKLSNQSPYTLSKVTISRQYEFSAPDTVQPWDINNIYVELNDHINNRGGVPNNPPSRESVDYSVLCPNGETDRFRITIKQSEVSRDSTLADVLVEPVGSKPYCLNLSNNMNLQWQWNLRKFYLPPTVVIKSQ